MDKRLVKQTSTIPLRFQSRARYLLLWFSLIWIAVVPPVRVLAAEITIIDSQNEFDGQTIQTVYTESDREFKLERKIEFFSRDKIVRKVLGFRRHNDYNKLKVEQATEIYSETGVLERVEVQFSADKAREAGYNKIITFYRPEGMLSKKEIHYTPSDFADQIYSKSIDYYLINGERSRSEYILSDHEYRRTGYRKLVSYYANGKIVKQELADKKGVTY